MKDMKNENAETQSVILEGLISVTAVLESGSRHIRSVWVDKNKQYVKKYGSNKPIYAELIETARKMNIPLEFVSAEHINKYTHGKTGGGVIAFASQQRYMTVSELMKLNPNGKWAALEGFEDPYNYGYAIRALYAAGFDGLITSRENWGGADTLVIKASAGASEKMPTALLSDYDQTIDVLRKNNVSIVCAHRNDRCVSLYDAEIKPPYLIIVGGEKRGIAKEFINAADKLVVIPYGGKVDFALPGVSAITIIAFELFRRESI